MSEHLSGQTAEELDFYRIRKQVARFAASEEGKNLLLRREPGTDRDEIAGLKALGSEWAVYLKSARPAPLAPWPPVTDSFKLLGIDGAQLSREQAFALGLLCQSADRLREAVSGAKASLPLKKLE